MNRSRDYYRKQRARTIHRKQRIIKGQHNYWYVAHSGMLSKGKIHCSCPMCRHKSYDEKSMSDKRKDEFARQQLDDFFSNAPDVLASES